MSDADAVDLALTLLRVALGAMIIAHAWNHVFGGGRIAGTGRWFASMGLRPGRLHAVLASTTELLAGGLLIVGFLTPVACAGILGIMVVAWVIAHARNGFFIFRPGQGWEYVMVVSVVSLGLATLGPGEWSLDHALDVAWSPLAGLVWCAALGLGGAGALLALFWRPGSE